ncbi:hypothetical protein E2C01_040876 [Portunus trituberculatus]|uniref:Uncharacterized protein n=1 Tax=Portunus trituberculatus TaxID=210409 RepID=A0A5B7FIJ7_PORTR|nr:hypothetical protein [Portunus trituberculatus]
MTSLGSEYWLGCDGFFLRLPYITAMLTVSRTVATGLHSSRSASSLPPTSQPASAHSVLISTCRPRKRLAV